MKKTLVMAAAFVLTASAAAAQMPEGRQFEVRPFVGASIPTGDQRDLFKDGFMAGAQFALEMKPTFHLLGSFGWVPTKTKYAGADDNVNILPYDLGLELGRVWPMKNGWEMRPFVGVGGGARTYLYAADQLSDKTCAAAYGALGTEFQLGSTALRLEARDNVFCYKSPISGVKSNTRNDVGVALGLAYHFR